MVATLVWKVMWFSSAVSTSCASGRGALTSSSGSPANTTRPSGTAQASPVKRRSANPATVASSSPRTVEA
nr:hypothetical protein [Allosalinactinospora lopnorensis]